MNDLFRDKEVDGLLSLRGGFGCLRLLEHLDLELIRRNPKLLVGFSDITILQNYLYESIGLVSLHGPVLTSLPSLSEIALERFYAALTGRYDTPVTSREL